MVLCTLLAVCCERRKQIDRCFSLPESGPVPDLYLRPVPPSHHTPPTSRHDADFRPKGVRQDAGFRTAGGRQDADFRIAGAFNDTEFRPRERLSDLWWSRLQPDTQSCRVKKNKNTHTQKKKETTTTTKKPVHFMRFIPWQTVILNIEIRLSMYLICCVTRFNVLRWFTMQWGCRQNLNHGTLHTFCTKTATLCLFLLYLYREKKKRSFGRLNFFSRTAAFFSHARIIEEVRQFIFLITCRVCIFIIIRAMFGQGHY